MQKWNAATENYARTHKQRTDSIRYMLLQLPSPLHWMATFVLRTEHAQPFFINPSLAARMVDKIKKSWRQDKG
jgi:hypothetical protein